MPNARISDHLVLVVGLVVAAAGQAIAILTSNDYLYRLLDFATSGYPFAEYLGVLICIALLVVVLTGQPWSRPACVVGAAALCIVSLDWLSWFLSFAGPFCDGCAGTFEWQYLIALLATAFGVVAIATDLHNADRRPQRSMQAIPAGWYDDPAGGGLRWWDGSGWTEHTHDG